MLPQNPEKEKIARLMKFIAAVDGINRAIGHLPRHCY